MYDRIYEVYQTGRDRETETSTTTVIARNEGQEICLCPNMSAMKDSMTRDVCKQRASD